MIPAEDKQFFKTHKRALLQLIPFAVLAIGVPALLFALKLVDTEWFFFGAASWLLALGIKSAPFFLSFLFPRLEGQISNPYIASIGEGILSAIAELGLTLAYFVWNSDMMTLKGVISFGLGVGFTEVLLIIYLLVEEIEKVTAEIVKDKPKGFILWQPMLERLLAIAGHVFSRGIIGLVLLYNLPLVLIAIPFLSFSFIDGWAGYIGRKWDMEDPHVLRKINTIHTTVVLIEAFVFFFLLLT